MTVSEIEEFEKQKSSTREVRNWMTGETTERKISKLCQYCPNEKCEGCLRKDSSTACLTMKEWRNGQKSLEDSIETKYYQNERHKKTDEFREWVFQRVLKVQGIEDYETKSLVGTFTSEVAKGENPFSLRSEFYLHLPDSICKEIEERRPD